MTSFPIHWIRERFPALGRTVEGRPAVFFDGPAGSQITQSVADAVGSYLLNTNANRGGPFATAIESDALLDEAHRTLADFLGGPDPDTVVFGANMTTHVFALSRALARTWNPGDEIVLSRLDHDANVTPWVLAARDAGVHVRFADVDPSDCTLDLPSLLSQFGERTRLVAVGLASNLVGSINPIAEIARATHEVGGLLFVDAVHFAPHGRIDVATLGCDFLACSAYKFFGPHVGVLHGRRRLLEELEPYKLRPAPDTLPGRWMTGTQNHEGIVGTAAAVEYLVDLGRRVAEHEIPGRSEALDVAFEAIVAYEMELAAKLIEGLSSRPGMTIHGITDPGRLGERVPTVSFTHSSRSPAEIARHLASAGIFVWAGHSYALPLTEAVGLEPEGVVRVGLLHYNTAEEIDRLFEALDDLP